MVSSYFCYKEYVKIKNHFSPNNRYDIIKYSNKINISTASFNRRNDKYLFSKLSNKFVNKQEYIKFLLANFSADINNSIIFLLSEEAYDIYIQWKKIREGLNYYFIEQYNLLLHEIQVNNLKFNDIFHHKENKYPIILNFFIGKKIDIDVFMIFNKILNFVTKYNEIFEDDLIWESIKWRIYGYEPFVVKDVSIHKQLILSKYRSSL